MERAHEGGCHCGRVRYRVQADLATERILECNCSICRKKGFLHLIVPEARFALLCGAEELSTYRFNTGVARHYFCRHCGVAPFYRPRSHPDHIDVNVRCLDDVPLEDLRIEPFDGERWEQNVDRIR